MQMFLRSFARSLWQSATDLAPIVIVIVAFQVLVLQQPFPDVARVMVGLILVLLGLTFFIRGLDMGLFPLGESMAGAFARKGNVWWLLAFGAALGFGTTVAEPALIAVADEAAKAQALTDASLDEEGREIYALALRCTVAVSVGVALMLGVLRIIEGWPLHWFIITGYVLVVILTGFAPQEIIGIAYDSGGVTTSTITVPLVTALGLGLANVIKGRSPLIDGFGIIAFASLMPIIFVLVFGMVTE
jgi:uncharacterized membrane protein (DUF2068 family)